MQQQRRKQKGFTLIELMIVVAIIGVLSAIAIPAYEDYVSRSSASSGLATLKALQTPAELEWQDNGTLSTVGALGTTANANTLGTIAVNSPDISFTFAGGALTGTAITLTRGATGWTCANGTGVAIEGCN